MPSRQGKGALSHLSCLLARHGAPLPGRQEGRRVGDDAYVGLGGGRGPRGVAFCGGGVEEGGRVGGACSRAARVLARLFSILAWLGRKGEGRGTRTSSTHVFLRPGGVSSSAGRLVPLVVVVVVREEERLFFRGDEPPVRGMTETLPSLGILGDGRDGLAFASSGARAARCFAGEPCMVVVLMVGVQEA